MKRTILFFALITSTILFSQTENSQTATLEKKKYPEYISKDDIKRSDKGNYSLEKTVKMKNGKSRDVDVNFSVNFYDYEPTELDIAKINIKTDQVLWLAKFNLKNKLSFEPYEITCVKKVDQWVIYLKYGATNDYGVEKDGLEVYKYDLQGKQIK